MNHFNIKTEDGKSFITLESADYKLLVTKDRELSENDYGYLYEGTVNEDGPFSDIIEYFVFEVVSPTEGVSLSELKRLTHEAMTFFFHSVLGVDQFYIRTPEFSHFYDADLFLDDKSF
jgi:hypothetical protein